jgi:tetrahydromethanopterin S-methyltransferase subunit B
MLPFSVVAASVLALSGPETSLTAAEPDRIVLIQRSALEERLDKLRPQIVEQERPASDSFAQWYNWPNWFNGWNNWNNWLNW